MGRTETPAWRRRLRSWWRQVRDEQTEPRQLGVAVGVGVLLGCSPFWGLQLALSLLVAWIFRLNKLAVLLGAQVSTPPFTPLFILGTAQLGERMLHGRWLALGLADVRATPARELLSRLFVDMFAGSLVIGGGLGVAAAVLTARVVHGHRARRASAPSLHDRELDALTDRLRRLPRFFRSYGWWKVRLDPAYPMALAALHGARDIVDLGAGIGLMEVLLVHRSPDCRVHGVEWDAQKVEAARGLTADLPGVSFTQEDAGRVALRQPDAIVMLDVLHYAPPSVQEAWVRRCVDALAPGGVLVIRELDSERGRSPMAERLDRLAVFLGLNKGGGVHAWPIRDLVAVLDEYGFEVDVRGAGRGLFAGNAMIVARKPVAERLETARAC